MRPSIEELDNETRFEKVMTMSYSDIALFVLGRLWSIRWPMALIWALTVISAASVVIFWPGLLPDNAGHGVLKGLMAGLGLIPLLLIPLHEGLHVLPFRLAGARNIRLGVDIPQGIIFITAHRFVAGRRLFSVVGFMPLLVISTLLISGIIFLPPWWKWVLSITLFVHTTMCSGDAAMLSFIRSFGNREVYTWDDADKREAYFFASKT